MIQITWRFARRYILIISPWHDYHRPQTHSQEIRILFLILPWDVRNVVLLDQQYVTTLVNCLRFNNPPYVRRSLRYSHSMKLNDSYLHLMLIYQYLKIASRV